MNAFLLVTFFCAFFLVYGLYALCFVRRDILEGRQPLLFRTLHIEIQLARKLLGESLDAALAEQREVLRQNIASAGIQVESAEVRGLQVLLVFGGASLTLAALLVADLLSPLAVLLVGIIAMMGWVLPVFWIASKATKRREEVSKSLPYALDLITSVLLSGLDFMEAIRYYIDEVETGALVEEFETMLNQISTGKDRLGAMDEVSKRMQVEELQFLVSAVHLGDDLGSPIAETLRTQAHQMRRVRQHKVDRKAERAPSLLLIPMGLFIMPAMFIVIIAPVFIKIKGSGLSFL